MDPSNTLAIHDVNTTQPVQEANLTAKDGLLIATECHLALLPDEDGDTALHLAVVQGNYEACRKLVDLFRIAGKSIDVHNNLLQTPLHVAVITNHKDIVKLLVCHGSDPNNPDRYGSTAFHLCAKYDNPECLSEIFQNLGDRKPDLNVRDYEGLTALHVAVKSGSISTFQRLVSEKADIDAKDNKGGRTPLIYAIEMNQRAIVELLLERDASVSQQTYSGDTALHIASGRGLQEIVRLLLRRGADATMKNTHSETPMSLASSPSVSDILRTQYNPTASPETKALTVAHTQYASYLARNISAPIPPNFLKFSPSDDKGSPPLVSRDPMQQRMRKLKIEHRGFDGDEATPPKRSAYFPPQTLTLPPGSESVVAIARSAVKVGEPVILPRPFPIKHEYMEFKGTQEEDANSAGSSSRGSDGRDDEALKRMPDFSDEHVEIAMEEVEVSGEEEAHKSDDESSPESHSSSIQGSPKKGVVFSGSHDQPYTHKLMQYSTNLLNKNLKDANNLDSKDNILNKDNGNKPVIVQRQPQIDLATVLSREYHTNVETDTSYKSFTPSVSPLPSKPSQVLMKSKSVPNSPQPAEANLYQLAREGLAVAAMANANPSQSSGREFGLSNYLKARPSRQAKIKSGTEELQNLALQGLAVAAMNAQSEFFQKSTGKKKQKSAEEGDTPSNAAAIPKQLPQTLKPVKDVLPPALHRSNSMPPKQYFEHETSPETISSANPMSSNNALLALAHANARKEHVGQAVSAKSMARSQSVAEPKSLPVTTVPLTANEISENTKHSLRQAIMVKNPTTASNGSQKLHTVYNPKKKKYQIYDSSNAGVKIYDPKFPGNQSISIKILPTPAVKTVTPTTKFSKTDDPMSGQLPTISLSHSTFTMPVAMPVSTKMELTKPKSPPRSLVKVSIPMSITSTLLAPSSQRSRPSIVEDNRPMNFTTPPPITAPPKTTILSQVVKTTKDSAPTHTVAPLQMPVQKGPMRKTDNDGQPKVVSVALAPVVTSRVASPAVQVSTTGPSPKTEANSNASPSSSQIPLPTTSVLPSTTFSSVTNGVSTLPHVALGGLPPQVLNPGQITNLGLVGAHPASSYLQHQIAYVPHGKDFIPVIVPQAAFQPQVQLPPYAALQVQSTGNVTKTCASTVSTSGDGHSYLNNVSKLPAIDPNLLYRMPLPLHDAQFRGLYPLYGTHLQQPLDAVQHHHQQLLKNPLLYSQSLLPQHKAAVGTQPLTAVSGLTSKPVAAVSAVPVHKEVSSKVSGGGAKLPGQNTDDQPLNLSKKPTREDQPLNLMKSHSASKSATKSEVSYRSSVIKAVSSIQSEAPKTVRVDALSTSIGASDSQVLAPSHAGVYLPPPVILNPAAAVPHPTQSAALSALSLPPIHYVNGMPFIFGVPPQI